MRYDYLLSRLWQMYQSSVQILALLRKTFAYRGRREAPGLGQTAASSSGGSGRKLNDSSEISSQKLKWSNSVTSPLTSLFLDGDSSESEDTLSSCERYKGSQSRPPTPKSSPQRTRGSSQTLKRSWMITLLEALPTGTILMDKSGQHWELGSLQTRVTEMILSISLSQKNKYYMILLMWGI